MNTKQPAAKPLPSPAVIMKPALLLTAICTVATLLLALTNLLTQARIAENAAAKAAQSRMLVLAADHYAPLDDRKTVYGAFDGEGNSLGVVITTQAKGYGGTIEVMTGIRSDGSVAGVTVLSMSETPGLGARTKEDAFLSQFIGLNDPNLAVTKDGGTIDAVSGATISSRAVTDAVSSAVSLSAAYLDASRAA